MLTKPGSFDVSPYVSGMRDVMAMSRKPQTTTQETTIEQPGQINLGAALNPLIMYLMMNEFFKPDEQMPPTEEMDVGGWKALLDAILGMSGTIPGAGTPPVDLMPKNEFGFGGSSPFNW